MLRSDEQAQNRDSLIANVNSTVQENLKHLEIFLSHYINEINENFVKNKINENFDSPIANILTYLDMPPKAANRLSSSSYLLRINENIKKIINALEKVNVKHNINLKNDIKSKERLIGDFSETFEYIKECGKYIWSPSPPSSPIFSKPFHETSNKENTSPNIKMEIA